MVRHCAVRLSEAHNDETLFFYQLPACCSRASIIACVAHISLPPPKRQQSGVSPESEGWGDLRAESQIYFCHDYNLVPEVGEGDQVVFFGLGANVSKKCQFSGAGCGHKIVTNVESWLPHIMFSQKVQPTNATEKVLCPKSQLPDINQQKKLNRPKCQNFPIFGNLVFERKKKKTALVLSTLGDYFFLHLPPQLAPTVP